MLDIKFQLEFNSISNRCHHPTPISQLCHQHVILFFSVALLVNSWLNRLVISVCLYVSRLEWLLVRLKVAVLQERVLGVLRQLIIIVFLVLLVFGWSVSCINPVCSVPSVEVLLSVVLVTVAVVFSVPPTLLREEISVLLPMEALVVLMSMEASIVASKLSIIFLHSVVKTAETVLFVRASVISRMIALVLLHRQVSIFLTRNVLPGYCIVVTPELVITFLVEVVALRIEEVATWKDVEVVAVVLSRSVLDLLPGVFLHSRNRLLGHRGVLRTFLRHHVRRRILMFHSWRQTRTILLESARLLRRWRLGLVLELTVDKTVLVELILVNFKQVFSKPETVVTLVRDATSSLLILVNTQLDLLHLV